MIFSRGSVVFYFANRDAVAQQNSITAIDARQQIERNIFHRARHAHTAHAHSVFGKNVNDFGVNKIHDFVFPVTS
jgi:hypothetical protein